MIWEFTVTGKMSGNLVERQGCVVDLYQDNIACLKATDDLKPVYFFAKNIIDDAKLVQIVLMSWRLSLKTPYCFKPQKTIINKILDNLEKLQYKDCLVMIEEMRKQRILPSLKPLQSGTQPTFISWRDVPSLCIV